MAAPTTQKAYQQKAGGPCSLVLNEALEVPAAGAGQVIVKNHGAGMNPIDWKATDAPYAEGRPFPLVAGIDGAGVITSIGEGVTDYAVGDKVFYCTGLDNAFGAYGQYSRVALPSLFKVPAEWNLTEAATAGCVMLTAAIALFAKLNVQKDQWVVVNGASGGVGVIAVQLAAFVGAKVIGVCSGKNAEFVKGLGAQAVVDYTKEDVVAKVKEITGGAGAPAVFDTVSTEPTKLIGAIAFNGGIATILPAALDAASGYALFASNISFHQILVLSYLPYQNAKVREILDNTVFPAIKAGKFKVPIEKKFTLDEVQQAVAHNQAGRTQGKVVVIIDESVQ